MEQTSLNKHMLKEGKLRYRKSVSQAKDQGCESRTPHGRRMIEGLLESFTIGIKDWIKENSKKKAGRNNTLLPLMKAMDPYLLALLTARVCIDACGTGRTYTTTMLKVGSAIEDEQRFQFLKTKHKKLWEKLKRQLDETTVYHRKRAIIVLTMNRSDQIDYEAWTRTIKLKLGVTLVDIFIKTTGVMEIISVPQGNKRLQDYLYFKQETTEWIEQFNQYAEMNSVMWLPMVQPPVKWTTPFMGGYDLEAVDGCTLIKTKNLKWLKEKATDAEMPDLYKSVNLLQDTAWKVNKYVYDLAKSLVSVDACRDCLPHFIDKEKPQKPDDIETNDEARKEWRAKASLVIKDNIRLKAKRIRVLNTMSVARKFLKVPEFYFPHQADFRGRLYCLAGYLTPQSNDFGRGLLEFSEGKFMNNEEDAKWLAIHGANLYGYDKVSMEDRHKWVLDNEAEIIRNAENPYDNTWWEAADKPWQFIAFCNEWARFKKIGPGFMTHLPVQVDGTNNGLQILSMLMKDKLGAINTNCANNELPVDAYQQVADKVIEQLDKDIAKGSEIAKYWKTFGITRKTTKRSVMILPYGGTFFSSAAYVKEWYRDEKEDRKLPSGDFKEETNRVQYLCKAVWDAVGSNVGMAQEAMKWMNDCAKLLAKEGQAIEWTTPNGMPILQDYQSRKARIVETALGDKVLKRVQLQIDTGNIDKRRQCNGISPNFVHSLDAAILQKTVTLANKAGIKSFSMIHDSFGAHCTDMDVLSAAIRTTIYNMFKEDLLSNFKDQMEAAYTGEEEFPELPKYGDFDMSEVLESEYLFS